MTPRGLSVQLWRRTIYVDFPQQARTDCHRLIFQSPPHSNITNAAALVLSACFADLLPAGQTRSFSRLRALHCLSDVVDLPLSYLSATYPCGTLGWPDTAPLLSSPAQQPLSSRRLLHSDLHGREVPTCSRAIGGAASHPAHSTARARPPRPVAHARAHRYPTRYMPPSAVAPPLDPRRRHTRTPVPTRPGSHAPIWASRIARRAPHPPLSPEARSRSSTPRRGGCAAFASGVG
ncbi:hypothetical protein BC628DRAFT_627322 [Trametes gibbosa]|nr:hypothetical protein BC628DRAFT_627322 [Trametes gibbosa]